jgi:hypothetical protein
MTQIDRLIEQLRSAIQAEIEAAERRGAASAATDLMRRMQAAIGTGSEPVRRRGRKPKP